MTCVNCCSLVSDTDSSMKDMDINIMEFELRAKLRDLHEENILLRDELERHEASIDNLRQQCNIAERKLYVYFLLGIKIFVNLTRKNKSPKSIYKLLRYRKSRLSKMVRFIDIEIVTFRNVSNSKRRTTSRETN